MDLREKGNRGQGRERQRKTGRTLAVCTHYCVIALDKMVCVMTQMQIIFKKSNSLMQMHKQKISQYQCFLLLSLELLQHGLELLLLLGCLLYGGLVLLVVGHGHHSQDQVDQVEGTQ